MTARPRRRMRAPQLLGLLRTFDDALAELDEDRVDVALPDRCAA